MARVNWKLKYFNKAIYKKIFNIVTKKKIKLFIFSKVSAIPHIFIKKRFAIYKGNLFRKITINKFIVGYKFGEFTFTKKPCIFVPKKKKKKF